MAHQGVERKLAAIMAADVVGYSRLMAADEEGTLARLQTLRVGLIDPTIAKHHGRIVKLMGDGTLVEFASVVDAVRCAVDMQRDMAEHDLDLPEDQRIRFRVGVNLGDVIIKGEDIYGDGVNIAARLEGLAEPGGIVISGTAFDHAKKAEAGFQYIGRQQVKNIPEPVRAYQVLLDPAAVGSVVDDEMPAATASRRWPALAAAIALTLVAVGALTWLRPWEDRSDAVVEALLADIALDTHRIAVLPFINMSADAENEYFADGITEELLTRIAQIGELSVIARTSIMKFKGTDKSIAEIGRELRAGTILTGSVRKAGDQVRITAQLIDVGTEAHVWADDYDRDLADIFAIQSAIAEEVAAKLEIELLGAEQQRLETQDTENPEAHSLYLKAHYLFNQQTSDSVARSIDSLKEAIALDPQYAAAYAALADFSNSLIWFLDITPTEAHGQARDYAEKALALDGTLARAYGALASAKMYGEFDWTGAEAAYKRALELNPSAARVHQHYGHFFLLASQRRDDEGLVHVQRSLELNPLSDGAMNSVGWVRYHRREYDLAIESFREGQELAPDDPWNPVGIGQALIFMGQPDAGIAELKRAVKLSPGYDFLLCYLAWGYGKVGRLDQAEEVVARLKAAAETKHVSPMAFAWAYTGMGDIDNAIAALEEAYQARDGALVMLRVPEFYDVLSGDPHYHALLERMGMES